MKNIVILLTLVMLFFSCKENVINGFDAKSVQKDLAIALNGSEWEAESPNSYYEKITFYNEVILVTRNGVTSAVDYDVTNVTGPMETLPTSLQLRLKSGLPTNELYVNNDYTSLGSVIRLDKNVPYSQQSEFKRVK